MAWQPDGLPVPEELFIEPDCQHCDGDPDIPEGRERAICRFDNFGGAPCEYCGWPLGPGVRFVRVGGDA